MASQGSLATSDGERAQHGDVDVLPQAGSARLMQRRKNANHPKQCHAQVGDGQAQPHRWLTFFARDIHDSAEGLDRGIERLGWPAPQSAPKPLIEQ